MKNLASLLLLFFVSVSTQAQLLNYSPEAADGYTLFQQGGHSHLINNCGEVINRWDFVSPQYHAKLLPNGNLIYIEWVSDMVKERAWDGSIVNEVNIANDDIDLDYEVIVLPNGNYLCIGRMAFSAAQFDSIGYTDNAAGFPQTVDVVVEISPEDGEVVWLWNTADHVIQDQDPTKPNFGLVKNNPQLMNLEGISPYDWPEEFFMINGMDYNENLDQIVLSLRKAGEIVIIDHSTTTEEAAGSTGGNAGRGGDILYRWGNPQNYDRGTEEDQYLFYQHNPNWIQHGPNAGSIIIYNNGLNRPNTSYFERYSTVPIIVPPILLPMGTYAISNEDPFGPVDPLVDFSKETTGHDFYSNYTSAAKVLPNGNILISVGGDSEIFELKPSGEEVWRYHLPNDPFLFRVEKYAEDYPAFTDKDLTPMGTLEDPPSTVPCNPDTGVEELGMTTAFDIWLAPEHKTLHITPPVQANYQYTLHNLSGQLMLMGKSKSAINQSLGYLSSGIYAVKVLDKNLGVQVVKVFIP